MSSVVESGAVLGVLGGGQLGAMFTAASRRLGYPVAVWDPDPDAPAHRLADYSFPNSFDDSAAYERYAALVRAVTYEWENVPLLLCERLEQRITVRPSSRILGVIQDRVEQKSFLRAYHLPVPAFKAVTSVDEFEVVEDLGYPCICKTAKAGYDGKGQWKITSRDHLRLVQTELRSTARPGARWIVEQFLEFDRELSLLAVRGGQGGVQVYPLVENIHENGILRQSIVPARVSPQVTAAATALAARVVSALDGVGIFCVELFLMKDGELLINEVAPRPHNSGHYTLDACTVSQFEQQVRSVCGLPLGEVRLLSPAVMLNLIGDEITAVRRQPDLTECLDIPGAILHVYGKRTVRPRRKMGHLTFVAPLQNVALARATEFRSRLMVEGASLPHH
ncbi:MAG: 5-(carboxyamino)imidazole ribonucleotide synthase [Nitrospiraceae bacterium]